MSLKPIEVAKSPSVNGKALIREKHLPILLRLTLTTLFLSNLRTVMLAINGPEINGRHLQMTLKISYLLKHRLIDKKAPKA